MDVSVAEREGVAVNVSVGGRGDVSVGVGGRVPVGGIAGV
jgi:hypothetical protein